VGGDELLLHDFAEICEEVSPATIGARLLDIPSNAAETIATPLQIWRPEVKKSHISPRNLMRQILYIGEHGRVNAARGKGRRKRARGRVRRTGGDAGKGELAGEGWERGSCGRDKTERELSVRRGSCRRATRGRVKMEKQNIS
jgi:hypothetical protein